MDIDVEQLIFEVQERPILWDTSSELYKDKNKKIIAWIDVCSIIDKKFTEKSKEDQEVIGKLFLLIWFHHQNNIQELF